MFQNRFSPEALGSSYHLHVVKGGPLREVGGQRVACLLRQFMAHDGFHDFEAAVITR